MAEMATKTDDQNYRNRSNSDPKPDSDTSSLNEKKIDGSGGDNTYLPSGASTTTRQVKFVREDGRKNGDSTKSSTGSGGTPPTDRKSKLSTLSRLFRPWKWRRKKKSERIEKTAVEIERKISMRCTREELIRKGVLKEPVDTSPAVPETLRESDEDRVDSPPPPSDGSNSASSPSPRPVPSATPSDLPTASPTVLPSEPTPTLVGGASSPAPPHTPSLTAVNQGPTVAMSSVMSRPMQMPSPSSPSTPHPPPPRYTEAVAAQADRTPVTFQLPRPGPKRIAIVAPQDFHSAEDSSDSDDSAGDSSNPHAQSTRYITDPGLINPASPYEAVLASEPDLNKRPTRSALKKPPGTPQGAMGGGRGSDSLTANGMSASSWTARPLDTRHPEGHHTSPQSTPVGTVKPIPRPRVSVNNIGDSEPCEGDKENSQPRHNGDQEDQDQRGCEDSDDSEDGEIRYKDDYDPNCLASKVARNDSLARFLENRPSKTELVSKNIIPEKTDSEKKDFRDVIGTKLNRRLSLRPTQEELESRNILRQQNTAEALAEKERKKRYLVRKLSFRPTIEELRERKIIDFSDYVEVTDAHEYDRRAEKPWTKLTPRDKAAIRKELNEFKSKEMDVHEDSRHFTRFHKP